MPRPPSAIAHVHSDATVPAGMIPTGRPAVSTGPVEGQGCRWNSRVTSRDRYSFAESGSGASASATTAISNFARAGLIASASRSSIVPDGRDGRRGFRSEPRDALFPSGRPLTHTTSQFHVACPRSLENARHRYGRLLHHRCQKASAETPWCRDWRRYLKEAERGARALGIRPVKAKPAKTDPSPARKQ
jgi:hypothetical protein